MERRRDLIPNEKKQSLYKLFSCWCNQNFAANDRRRDGDVGPYVEQRAVQAMCALLCCGPIFEPSKSLGEDGYLYGWLNMLLSSNNPSVCCELGEEITRLQVEGISERTLAEMLDLNDDCGPLLDWTLQRCYCAPAPVAARAFRALTILFSRRSLPFSFNNRN